MKHIKLILSSSLVLFAICAQAQVKNPISFGLRAGVSFQNINGKDYSGDKLSNNAVTRYSVGANVEVPIATDFYIQPGLLFATKGALADRDLIGQPSNIKTNISYLEVPVNLLYKPTLSSGKLIMGFGPYIAFGLGGKTTLEGSGQKQDYDVKFQNTVKSTDHLDQTNFKRIDAGANLLFGYEFTNKISAQMNAQLGLTKINPEYNNLSDDKSSWKNTGFGLSVGYRF